MIQYTSDAAQGLLFLPEGQFTARWNYPAVLGGAPDALAGLGQGVTLSVQFLDVPAVDGPSDGFAPLNAAQRVATRAVLESIASMVNVQFVEVSAAGQMRIGLASMSAGVAGYATPPSYGYSVVVDAQGETVTLVTESSEAGDVYLSSTGWDDADFLPSGSGWGTLLHEVGHALGLDHPFDGAVQLDPTLDNWAYSVMSYTPHPQGLVRDVTLTGNGYSAQYAYVQPETLMPLDILALQHLYGANRAFHAGDDHYVIDPTQPFIRTLWDGGGRDTVSAIGFTQGVFIDLTPGSYSSLYMLPEALPSWAAPDTTPGIYDGSNNLAIAYGVDIENAVGGAGSDVLMGNGLANELTGNAGDDTLTGGLGNDTFTYSASGNGRDRITDFAQGDVVLIHGVALTTAQVSVDNTVAGVLTLLVDTQAAVGVELQVQLQGSYGATGWVVQSRADGNTAITYDPNAATSARLDGQAYHWKTHALLGNVAVQASASSGGSALAAGATGTDGHYQLDTTIATGTVSLSATRATTDSANAITSADALAALRIAVGLNPNADPDGAGPLSAIKVSPYQYIAADANKDGKITSADALAILRMAVKAPTALGQEWLFVNESKDLWNETAGASSLTKANATWDAGLSTTLQSSSTVNLVGVLKGDVNGSWTAPAGSIDLDVTNPTYFQLLGTQLGVPTDVWGVV